MTDAKKKSWSFSAGERGVNRVRAFERATTGQLFLEHYEASHSGARPRVHRVALVGLRDKNRAKEAAERLAAELRCAAPLVTRHVTLAKLFDIYCREVTPGKSSGKQRHDRTCVALFSRAFGAEREARSLSRREWDRFIRERSSGSLRPGGVVKPRTVGSRQVAYDLRFLLAVLNWAVTASDGRGETLLERNPLHGLSLPRDGNPRRPIVDDLEFERLVEVAPKVGMHFELALILAHETGHRINSIRQLRWSDVDLDQQRVRWRAEHDKIGLEHVTPLSARALAALERARKVQRAIGDAWVFPSPTSREEACSRHLMRDWWKRGEALAGLPPSPRRGWHALRRNFATALKEIPLKDLCALGGWRDPQTILKCYQSADETTMRSALANRRQLCIGGDR